VPVFVQKPVPESEKTEKFVHDFLKAWAYDCVEADEPTEFRVVHQLINRRMLLKNLLHDDE
jgi:hypothetical protein